MKDTLLNPLSTGDVIRILISNRCKEWETMIMAVSWESAMEKIEADLKQIRAIAGKIG